MDIKQISNKAASWNNLPSTNTLLQYLHRHDLTELSKCCKRYRSQLEQQILGRLYLYSWKCDDTEIHSKPREDSIIKKSLECLESDLGSKIKYVNSIDLLCDMSKDFTEKYVNLLPNIKVLRFYGNCDHYWGPECVAGGNWQQSLITALNSISHLEHVKLSYICEPSENYSTKKQVFPKSLKSLDIDFVHTHGNEDKSLALYDTINASYIHLYTLKIVSNGMLQSLSSRMPNLKEVKIGYIRDLDRSKLIDFLKANPQLRKLTTSIEYFNEEIFNTVLSLNHLYSLYFYGSFWKEIEANTFPSNYSIKYLKISSSMPPALTLKIIKACKGLETLDINYMTFNELDILKLERRINSLKLFTGTYGNPIYNPGYAYLTLNAINDIGSLRPFNRIHFRVYSTIEKYIEDYNIDKLKNYKFIPSISKFCTLKLISKTD